MVHPVLMALAKASVREQLRAKGHSLRDSIKLANMVDSGLIQTAADAGAIELPTVATMGAGAVGGTIIDFLLQFINSDLGKALIALILKLIGG